MRWTIESGPDGPSAGALRLLWERAAYRNPFCAPAFLGVMAASSRARGWTPLVALGLFEDGEPAGAWPLATDHKRRLRFLQHEYSDQCTVLAAPGVTSPELATGLAQAVGHAAPSAVALTNVPPWGPTLEGARLAVEQCGWRAQAFPAKPCPVLRVESPDALIAELDRHRSPRRYWTRLQKDEGATLELLTDPAELDHWCDEFCDSHEWRWSRTTTPSQYRNPAARVLFRDVVRAWQHDGVLLCFALRVHAGRAAFAVVLDARTRLLYHHLALSPLASRAGTVLMWLVARWAGERGYTTFDLGLGGEPHKYRLANIDERLWRLYAAPSRLSFLYARATIERSIRSTGALRGAWDRFVNPYVRQPLGWAASRLRRLHSRARRE